MKFSYQDGIDEAYEQRLYHSAVRDTASFGVAICPAVGISTMSALIAAADTAMYAAKAGGRNRVEMAGSGR